MKTFLEAEPDVEKINLVITVTKNNYTPQHRNRVFHGVVLGLNGSVDYCFLGGPVINIEKGEIIYLPRFSDYDVEAPIPGDCIAINFLLRGEERFEPFKVRSPGFISGRELFRTADSIWNAKNQGYLFKSQAILYDIFYLMDRSLADNVTSIKGGDKILETVKIIEKNYYRTPIKISELAKIAGMSEVYFRRQFRKIFGVSPLKYITNLKITRSRELLESGMYHIKDIAMMCGYEDVYYFSRDFRKATELSPREYKNRTITKPSWLDFT